MSAIERIKSDWAWFISQCCVNATLSVFDFSVNTLTHELWIMLNNSNSECYLIARLPTPNGRRRFGSYNKSFAVNKTAAVSYLVCAVISPMRHSRWMTISFSFHVVSDFAVVFPIHHPSAFGCAATRGSMNVISDTLGNQNICFCTFLNESRSHFLRCSMPLVLLPIPHPSACCRAESSLFPSFIKVLFCSFHSLFLKAST